MQLSRTYSTLIQALLVVLACTSIAVTAHAQVGEGDLVYRFSVAGVDHRTEAKPVQYALMEHASSVSCDFIPECACFKLASNVPLDYIALKNLVAESGEVLTGEVAVSNGTVLRPPAMTLEP